MDQTVKARKVYNDAQIFDIRTKVWQEVLPSGRVPRPRQSHVGASIGGVMLVHGGYSFELKKTLNDFNLFDMRLHKWLKISLKREGVLFEPSEISKTKGTITLNS